MKGKERFNVLILCCCLLILLGSFLPYIAVSFPNTNAGQAAAGIARQQLPELIQEDGSFSATAVEIISTMQTENKGGVVKAWFIVTLFLNLVCVLSLLTETNGKFVLILALDLLQAALWAGGVFILLPYGIVKASGIAVTAYTGNAVLAFLTRTQEAAQIRDLLLRSMGIGYWMQYVFAFLSFVLCIAAFFAKPKRRPAPEPARRGRRPSEAERPPVARKEPIPQEEPEGYGLPVPGVTCVAGPYAGSHAPMEFDEEMVIGSDEDACSLVILSALVSPVHCRVRFDRERNEYLVMSLSVDGTFINNFRIDEHTWLPLQRGACLRLGHDANILQLD